MLCWVVAFPPKSEVSSVLKATRHAVKGLYGGHESVELQQVLLLGHTSDLLCIAVQRAIVALHKWRASHLQVPRLVPCGFLSCVSRAVVRLGGSVPGLGLFRFGTFTWDTSAPVGFVSGYAHCLRQFWRLSRARVWLQSQRNDAHVARGSHLVLTSSLLDRFRSVSQSVDGHARQAMIGGLATLAHASEPPNFCDCCLQNWFKPLTTFGGFVQPFLIFARSPVLTTVLPDLGGRGGGPIRSSFARWVKFVRPSLLCVGGGGRGGLPRLRRPGLISRSARLVAAFAVLPSSDAIDRSI